MKSSRKASDTPSHILEIHYANFEESILAVTCRSPFDGAHNTRYIHATTDQFQDWFSGSLIQNAFPQLTPETREFLLTGITPEEWDDMMEEEEEV
jgi:hypothetical protein